MDEQELAPSTQVVDVQFRPGQKVYYFDPQGLTLKAGDHVIIDTARGPEYGTCTSANRRVLNRDLAAPLRPVLRLATPRDEQIAADNRNKEKRACDICNQRIRELGLDMQLVSAECAFDGSKLLFFFTADERVDFRELVKNLAGIFHTRIELRQIGVRDKAKMVGGLGICGRPFCCASFLEDFQPVSIKMAKTQNLSLNPTKISGTCGRLMCCLKYEQDAYEALLRTSPKAESLVDTPDGRGTVVELDLLRQRVRVRMEAQPETVNTYANTDIAVLRNGKAKKNDPPIPADLAPISGAGKRAKPTEAEQEAVHLEPIRFRYSTDTIAEAYDQEEPKEEDSARRPRRKRRAKPEQEAAPQAPAGEAPEDERKDAAEAGEKAERKPRRRPNFRRKKPRSGPAAE